MMNKTIYGNDNNLYRFQGFVSRHNISEDECRRLYGLEYYDMYISYSWVNGEYQIDEDTNSFSYRDLEEMFRSIGKGGKVEVTVKRIKEYNPGNNIFKVKQIYEVDSFDFDTLINNYFGRDENSLKEWDYVSSQEAHNDSAYTHHWDGVLSQSNQECFDRLLSTEVSIDDYMYSANLLGNALVKFGVIEAGEYLVKVSW